MRLRAAVVFCVGVLVLLQLLAVVRGQPQAQSQHPAAVDNSQETQEAQKSQETPAEDTLEETDTSSPQQG